MTKNHHLFNWDADQLSILYTLYKESDLIPGMARRNPQFLERLTNFLLAYFPILALVGESGMGKSLLMAEIRRIHTEFNQYLRKKEQSKLAVITWDRSHQVFYEVLSTWQGTTIGLPAGETPWLFRNIISSLMGDCVNFTQKYIHSRQIILLEMPAINMRGENLLAELLLRGDKFQVFAMHSPESREEILQRGSRLSQTSGQVEAMKEIRRGKLKTHLALIPENMSSQEEYEIIRQSWLSQINQWNGAVIEWSPNDNRFGYERAIKTYTELNFGSDLIAPPALSHYANGQVNAIFEVDNNHKLFNRLLELKS